MIAALVAQKLADGATEIGPIAGVISLSVAVLGFIGVLIGVLFSRIGKLETDLESLRGENQRLWGWARTLLDYGYKYRRPEAPDPPAYEDTVTRANSRIAS